MKPCASVAAAGAVLGFACGCSPGHDHGTTAEEHAGHDHDEEPATAQITVFGERHEIFAEHRLAVAGTSTKFVTHVTDLRTLEPRREGPVRFLLRFGQEAPIEVVEKAPARAGIYEAMLTFPKAGEWEVTMIVPGDDGDKSIEFPKVKVFADAHEAQHGEVPESPEGISFLKEQQWKVRAGTEVVAKRRLVEQLRLPATVLARPGGLAQVTPPVAGRLLLPPDGQLPVVGDQVKAGQVLALIQPAFSDIGVRFLEAEGEVVKSKLALEQADLTFRRVEQLAKAEAKSARDLQEAQFELRTAQARHDAALALRTLYRQAGTNLVTQSNGGSQPVIELRAPLAGTITAQSGAAVGEYITAEKSVFTVLDAGTVFIEARVPEASLKRLGEKLAATCEVPGEPAVLVPITGDGRGRLVSLGLQVDAATRTVPLLYEVKNSERLLRVGQFVYLQVETSRAEEALAVPCEAVVEEGGRPVVFVQLAGETFEKRDLALGIRDGDWVQVTSGLRPGERVVTQGAYAVRLASVSAAIPSHGHAH
jgi:RND family efflux transporter MFP subunit